MVKGSCLCGAVTFEITSDIISCDACHCTQCRKHSGHYFASTDVSRSALKIYGANNISWYHSSPKVRRGFCSQCGANLFWYPIFKEWTSVAMGAIDGATNTKL